MRRLAAASPRGWAAPGARRSFGTSRRTAAPLAEVTLDDKYDVNYEGRVFVTGIQALVRLPLVQWRRDQAAGLKTAGLISGYRGSPLAGYDQALWKAKKHLAAAEIEFIPGVNEELGATTVWGTQQVGLYGDSDYDGVFGIWYGKGPGVDRSGDAFKHANLAGTSPTGGVLLVAGDDHLAKSSTLAHQSELALVDASIPVLNPAGLQETIDYGLLGIAMSRFSGLWVSLKTTAEAMDGSESIDVAPDRLDIAVPADGSFETSPDGLHIRLTEKNLQVQEVRVPYKLNAAQQFWFENGHDREVTPSPAAPKLGIATTGKSYLDVLEALGELGLDSLDDIAAAGISVFKVGMSWPLEPRKITGWALGVDQVLVVEEKRSLIEGQLKDLLYNRAADGRVPQIAGKKDTDGRALLPVTLDITPAQIAEAVARYLPALAPGGGANTAGAALAKAEAQGMRRTPYFCAGCPHNSSTKVPEGSRAIAGIGCSYMSLWMDRSVHTSTHMGGEGLTWLGQEPFVKTEHVFANMGDGTYMHSGSMAIRQAVAANSNITYKILYNDAVSMTGGQPLDCAFTVPEIYNQLRAEGVKRVVVVTDEPARYKDGRVPGSKQIAAREDVMHRDYLNLVQRELRQTAGVTALIYDQTCAAEKRRRRKRGAFPNPPKRLFINPEVCEGCGDCGAASNCVALKPLETQLGRKRQIDQSACNKDYSCIRGFCPSFVTVHNGEPRKKADQAGAGAGAGAGAADSAGGPALPEPVPAPVSARPWNILVCGIGGTGVVTIGALLGMAAHLEGLGVTVLDQVGLAQKGGSVVTHVRVGATPDAIRSNAIGAGKTDLILGCDMVTAAAPPNVQRYSPERTHAIVNLEEQYIGQFAMAPDMQFPASDINDVLASATQAQSLLPISELARSLLGDSIASNMFCLGVAYQKGLLPLSADSLLRAVELNGVAVDFNKQAFEWGRRAVADPQAVRELASSPGAEAAQPQQLGALEDRVEHHARFLVEYQGEALADRFRRLVARVREAEEARCPGGGTELAEAVARYYFKLLAYKDEYEVARLYSKPSFRAALDAAFEGDYTIEFNLAPQLLAKTDPVTGAPLKRAFGSWILPVFELLAGLRGLRGTPLDPFGYQAERRAERRLIADYEQMVERMLAGGWLAPETRAVAVQLARLPEAIRGFGHVKERHIAEAKEEEGRLMAAAGLRQPSPAQPA